MKLSKYAVIVVLLAVAGAGAFVATHRGALGAAPAPDKGAKGVPVKVDLASRGDAHVYLDSIATVQAFNTVSVRPRVDGQIERVGFTEGSAVKRGEVLVELDKRPFEVALRAALAQEAKDAALLVAAKRNVDRYEELIKQGMIAPQMLEATRATYEQLRATLDADRAQTEQARLQLGYATIRAPIDGRAGARLVDAGNVVHISDAGGLVTLSQIHPIAVSFALPQAMLATLREQQGHRPLAVSALAPDGQTVIDEGSLTLIDNQVDVATGTIRCKATFPNNKEALWPGASVSVRVMLEDMHDAVTAPTIAIQAGAKRSFVFVVGADNLAESRDIEAGPVSGQRTVILSGLRGGERVIVEGQFQTEAGKRVAPVASAR